MNGQLLEEINTTMFTSSKQGKELVTELQESLVLVRKYNF